MNVQVESGASCSTGEETTMSRDECRESKMDHHEQGARVACRAGDFWRARGRRILAANEEKPLHAVDVMAEAMKIR